MSPNGRIVPLIVMILIMTSATNGCNDAAVEVAREAADRQAAQNETMARLQGEVAQGSRQLVEEEGKARRQALAVHRDLQSERSQLTQGWDQLETERRSIAAQRRIESLLAAVASGGAATLAGLLALAVAWLVTFGLHRADDDAPDACVLLMGDTLVDDPLLDLPPWSTSSRAELPPPGERKSRRLSERPATADADKSSN